MSIDIAKDRILEKVPLENLIGESLDLKRQSGKLVGLCPFHQEKSGSFTLYEDHYHCFGCGAHGDAITFIRKKLGLGFIETLQYLADKYQIEAPEIAASKNTYSDSRFRSLYYQMTKASQEHFIANLHSSKGQRVINYLLERGFAQKEIKAYGFGYSLDEPQRLASTLRGAGFEKGDIIKASMASSSQRSGHLYDFFQNRLTIPICDRHGRIIAFGGRTMGDHPAKYKNSRDTELFDKSTVLFGVHQAISHIQKKKRAILVEGYMDAMMLWSKGFLETVACLGTSLTLKHLRTISQLTSNLYLLFDGDSAGHQAHLKTVNHALEVPHLSIKVTPLPKEDDPDSYVRREGDKKLEQLLSQKSEPLLEYAISSKINAAHGLDIPHLIQSEFIPWLKTIPNNIQRAYLKTHLTTLTGIDVAALNQEISKPKKAVPKKPELPPPAASYHIPQLTPLEYEFLGQLYWAAPGEIVLEGIDNWLIEYMEWDQIWLELAREFIVCLIAKEAPSQREPSSWRHSSLNEVIELIEKLRQRKEFFQLTGNEARNNLLEKVKHAQEVKKFKKVIEQLKGEMTPKKPSLAEEIENIRLLKEIFKINQKLKVIKQLDEHPGL